MAPTHNPFYFRMMVIAYNNDYSAIPTLPLDDFMTRLRVPLEHEIAERDLLPHGLKDEMFDYYLAFLLSGIIGIYRTWALSDGSVPIERVSEVANDLTLNGLSSLESRFE